MFCCVQGAIVTMTKALAKDLIKKKGIRVNAGMLLSAPNTHQCSAMI